MKTFVAYYRVSTEEQSNSGLGLEAQKRLINNYVSSVEGTILKSYSDLGVSGSKSDRPGLNDAIKYARKTNSTLIVQKLDRLSRDMSYTVNLLKSASFPIICADAPNDDTFILHIKASVAQAERETISKRTKVALAEKKAQGVKLGGRQSGGNYKNVDDVGRAKSAEARKVKALARLEDWLEEIREVTEKVESGWSWIQAARHLSDQGMKSARGGKLNPGTLYRNVKMLKNEGLL